MMQAFFRFIGCKGGNGGNGGDRVKRREWGIGCKRYWDLSGVKVVKAVTEEGQRTFKSHRQRRCVVTSDQMGNFLVAHFSLYNKIFSHFRAFSKRSNFGPVTQCF